MTGGIPPDRHFGEESVKRFVSGLSLQFLPTPTLLLIKGNRLTWQPKNSVNIWNLLWLSMPLIICTDQANI